MNARFLATDARAVATVALLLLIGAAEPPQLEAQCEACEERYIMGQWEHRFPTQPPPGGGFFDGDHTGWQAGACSTWHNECLAEGSPEGPVDLEALALDATELREAVLHHPAVVFDEELGEVLLIGCTGDVLARLALSSDLISAITEN